MGLGILTISGFFFLVICIWLFSKPKLNTIGIVFVSLVALFIGGCGLLWTLAGLGEWGEYRGVVFIISLPSLVGGLLIGLLLWRSYKYWKDQPKE